MKILNSCLGNNDRPGNPHIVNAKLCCEAPTMHTIETRVLIVSNISVRYKITFILPMRLSYMRLMLLIMSVGITGYINYPFQMR